MDIAELKQKSVAELHRIRSAGKETGITHRGRLAISKPARHDSLDGAERQVLAAPRVYDLRLRHETQHVRVIRVEVAGLVRRHL